MALIIVDTSQVLEMDAAADALGIGIATLYRWIKQGKITPLKIGQRAYILQTEIDRLNNQRS